VQHHHMADQNVITDRRRKSLGVSGSWRINMYDCAVLDVGSLADLDAVHITTQNAIIPDAGFRADFDIAYDVAAGRYERGIMNIRRMTVE
jgi:hypothetical protein